MKVSAYILAADPAWIESSVMSYYDIVDEIIVSYDGEGRGWTGSDIQVETCLTRLKAIDKGSKLRFCPGDYFRPGYTPMENETYQRQCALVEAGSEPDWVLMLDTDEILPKSRAFLERLRNDVQVGFEAVEWPMRTFFQYTLDGKLLEVCSIFRKQVSAFPGPIAVRPGVRLKCARQTDARRWRCDIRPKDTDPAAGNRRVDTVIPEQEAILHLSWIRSETEIRSKLQSWGHSGDFDWQRYLERTWKSAPQRWRRMYHFHPMCAKWWPALRAIKVPENLLVGESAGR